MEQYKTCGKCKQTFSITDFYSNKATKNGLTSYCKTCHKAAVKIAYKKNSKKYTETAKKYRIANKSSYNAWQRAHYKKDPLRYYESKRRWVLSNSAIVSGYQYKRRKSLNLSNYQFTKKDIRRLTSNVCYYCQQVGKTEIDHVLPVSKGGRHSIGNLVPACVSCNRSKGAKFYIVWRLLRFDNDA